MARGGGGGDVIGFVGQLTRYVRGELFFWSFFSVLILSLGLVFGFLVSFLVAFSLARARGGEGGGGGYRLNFPGSFLEYSYYQAGVFFLFFRVFVVRCWSCSLNILLLLLQTALSYATRSPSHRVQMCAGQEIKIFLVR